MRLTVGLCNKKIRRYLIGKFIDSVKVHVQSGDGADGMDKFGGLGGKGGDIVLEANPQETLDSFYKRWRKTQLIKADSGQKSKHNRIFGHNGANKILSVPLGVSAFKLQKNKGVCVPTPMICCC
jgi:GTPase involved in cell partitioning and DNA repair